MATARKRGKKWRCLAYVGKDLSGKRLYKSFTADTKNEAERMAAEYELTLTAPKTVGRAVGDYINIKAAVLSPSTIRGYRIMQKTVFSPIANARFDTFGSADAQKWISAMVESGKSPKYVKNAYSLLTATMRLLRPQKPISAVLPTRTRKLSYTPTNDEIRAIMGLYDDEMQIAIMLAAYCSLRCGEICALTSSDLNGNVLTVNKAYTRTESGEYALKPPKTPGSTRQITVPGFLLERLQGKEGRFVQRTPQAVSLKFADVAKKNGVPFRFHALRHYFASELAKTMPLAVVERMGGWSPGSTVLRNVYINAQQAELKKAMEAASAHFEEVQPETQP